MVSLGSEFGKKFKGKTVLVTGSTGFIGSHLCEALLLLDAKVYGLGRSSIAQANNLRYHYLNVDLTEFEETKKTILTVKPDLVYHLAGMVTGRQDIDLVLPMLFNNLVGTIHVFLSLMELKCERVILASSSEEPTLGAPTSPYAAAKAAASMYAGMFHKIYNLPVIITRLFMSYGPGQDAEKLIPYTILSLLHKQVPQLSNGERKIDFVYVLDVVRGLLRAAYEPDLIGKKIELGSGNSFTIREVVFRIIELLDSSVEPKFGERRDRFAEKPLTAANIDETRRNMNWKPRWDLKEGMLETIDWYRNELEVDSGSR